MDTAKKTVILCLLVVLWAGAASAGEKRVGVIMTGNSPYYSAMHDAFAASVAGRLPAGDTVRFLLQRPFPDSIALANAARKLIVADVDIIVAYGTPAIRAVLDEKSMIPVVYAGVYDPLPMAFKGANTTGCGYKLPISSLLRHLKTLKDIESLGVIYSSLEEDSVRQVAELESLARAQHIRLKSVDIRGRRDLADLASIKTSDASFITGSSVVSGWLEKDIMPLLQASGQATASVFPDLGATGIVITLAHNPSIQGRKAMEIAVRVLRGERPEAIPPEILSETELVFNLLEAKELGLKVPIKLIADATKVIR